MDINELKNESGGTKPIIIILVVLALMFVVFIFLANRKAKNPAEVPAGNKTTEAAPTTPADVPASEIIVPDDFKVPTAMPPELEQKIDSSELPDPSKVTPPNPFPENR